MALYKIKMQHNEDTLVKLSHMQYDLFCQKNRAVRTVISVAIIVLSISVVNTEWLRYVLIAYAGFLLTGTYNSANRTAHKLTDQIKASGMPFPASRYEFEKSSMHIFSLPEDTELGEALPYSKIFGLGEDTEYFYIFRDQYGGYMLPKSELGEKKYDFKTFIESKTNMKFVRRATLMRRMQGWLKKREDEPYHL